MVKMSDLTESDITKPLGKSPDESTFVRTVLLTINLITNILICLTVFVSLVYTFNSTEITIFQWHIILCVLGYQLLMCQGVLVISKYNSWSMYLSRQKRKRLHILFQLLGFLLVTVGSSLMIRQENQHFNSAHGILGIFSLITSAISMVNGTVADHAYKLSRSYILLIKFIHYTTGILSLFLSAAALSTGFEEFPFRMWVKNDNAVAGLVFITWLFTLLVALDFWLATGQRLRNLMK